jgi:S1-C subfamily serine protease
MDAKCGYMSTNRRTAFVLLLILGVLLIGCAAPPSGRSVASQIPPLADACLLSVNQHLGATAVQTCSGAIVSYPRATNLLIARSVVFLDLRQFDATIADTSRAIALGSTDPYAWNNRAYAHFRKGDLGRAIADYSEALRRSPRLEKALVNRAVALRDAKLYLASLADIDTALGLNPQNAALHAHRAVTLLRLNRLDDAQAAAEYGVRLVPNNPFAINVRGVIRERQQDLEGALADYATAMALAPDFAAPANNHRSLVARMPRPAEPVPTPPPAVAPAAPDAPEILDLPEDFTPVPGSTEYATGSGVVVGDGDGDGSLVVTNHHVIQGARSVSLRNGGGHVREAEVIATSAADDLALLRIASPFPGCPGLPFSALALPVPGHDVVILGYPQDGPVTAEVQPVTTLGRVVNIAPGQSESSGFETTAFIYHGNSGSPAFDEQGHLIGIMKASLHYPPEARDRTAVSLGVSSERILRLLGRSSAVTQAETSAFSSSEIYRRSLTCVVLVAAYR